MKLLLVTTVKEYEVDLIQLFKKNNIRTFSNTSINGFKTDVDDDLTDNWFPDNEENINSVLFFSFTNKEKIEELLKAIKIYNSNLKSTNLIKALVLNVEKFI